MEPLAIVFVWNFHDEGVKDYIDYMTGLLSRNVNMPYSRTVDLPIFFYRNMEGETLPPEIRLQADKIIVFVFIGKNSVACDGWDSYVEQLYNINNVRVVPIALDKTAMNINKTITLNNFIRLYDFKLCKEKELFISVAHEVFRYGFNDEHIDLGSKGSALRVFLSHTKEAELDSDVSESDRNFIRTEKRTGNGLMLARQLKNLIDKTCMNRFFDASDIAPAYRFDLEIKRNIDESSMVVINSDLYASRYWCQREIQQAKKDGRPVIEVDVINTGMDRKLPYAGNIPVVRINMREGKAKDEDLLRILEAILIETIRHNYALSRLENEQKVITEKVKIICRPPEMMDLESVIERKANGEFSLLCDKIMYPDPPVYSEETEFFERNGIRVFTPIEIPLHGKSLAGKSIGISISDVDVGELMSLGQDERHTKHLSTMIANYVLGRGATLVYGGDLRKDGYTEQLILEASVLRDRLRSEEIHLKNYVAWPIYLIDSQKSTEWKAKNKNVLQMINVPIHEKVANFVESPDIAVIPDTLEHKYMWSRSLTKMRLEMISVCSACICAGGRLCGYKGVMPGVLEEILIASAIGCPIYLLGGFGGVTKRVCETIQTGKLSEELTVKWQKDRNNGYEKLLEKYTADGEPIDYENLGSMINGLKLNNGLTKEENETLFSTVFIDEALHLIMKGLQTL